MNKNLIIIAVIIVVVVGGFVLLQGQQSPQTTTPPATQTETSPATTSSEAKMQEAAVTVTASGFAPQTVTVKAGTKVVWTNKSGTTVTVNSAVHPTHLAYPPLNLDSFANGQSVQLVFDKPGTYKYHNHLSPGQTGTVVVTAE